MRKLLLFSVALLSIRYAVAQTCTCEMEFRHIKDFMEVNYSGFKDKVAQMTQAGYARLVKDYISYTKGPHSTEKCLLIISSFLDHFGDDHISVRASFDATKSDSFFISQRELISLPERRLRELARSTSPEGIYHSRFDSSYRIAIIQDKTPLHDYIGVIISSKVPGWKRGMLKFAGKFINDSVLKGVLYMKNQLPKVEWFWLQNNSFAGDWLREGTAAQTQPAGQYQPVASRKLSNSTLYIKIASFDPSNAGNIDSVLAVNKSNLSTMPNLVLDLRDNGGGADFAYLPLLPYLYTNPVRTVGTDIWCTDSTIAGWKRMVESTDFPAAEKIAFNKTIALMEAHKGQFVSDNPDYVDSSLARMPNPSKVIILINSGCASTTEQFLLAARQSSKVRLFGQNTSGTLDYSTVRRTNFLCMPYTLGYSTTRSRRLDHHAGIDHVGIRPDHYLDVSGDWIAAAMAAVGGN
jgi:hypothetical protein